MFDGREQFSSNYHEKIYSLIFQLNIYKIIETNANKYICIIAAHSMPPKKKRTCSEFEKGIGSE
jgi:hypothetical protein